MSPALGKIFSSILYGLLVFIGVIILAIIINLLPGAAEVSALLRRFALVIGVLAGLVAYFAGGRNFFQ